MPNYQETSAPGTLWKRCHRVVIENPMEGGQMARLFEEEVVNIGGKTVKSDCGMVQKAFDPAEPIMLRDPATGELTGAYVTQMHLYEVLYSLYMQAAIQRDLNSTPAVMQPE
jgi:hypothetical protein